MKAIMVMYGIFGSLCFSYAAINDPLAWINESLNYKILVDRTLKISVRNQEGRVAFYWGALLTKSLNKFETTERPATPDPKKPPNGPGYISYPDSVLDRGFSIFKSPHSSAADQLMRLWFEMAVLLPDSPPGFGYGDRIASWATPTPGSTAKPVPIYGNPPEVDAEIKRRILKWRESKDRFPELIVYRVFNSQSQPRVSDEDLAWLGGLDSPFRPIAVAELRVREGKSGKSGPWTARWSTWVSQNKGILRDLLVRRVKRLLDRVTIKPSPIVAIPPNSKFVPWKVPVRRIAKDLVALYEEYGYQGDVEPYSISSYAEAQAYALYGLSEDFECPV